MDDEPQTSKATQRKRAAKSKTPEPKKREIQFEDKKNVAIEVGRYKNLHDTSDPNYMNKIVENASWKKVSEATGLSVEICIEYWNSLKRSAKYHARPPRIPYVSGAEGGEVPNKYKDDWQYANYMAFYTPPSLKNNEPHMSVCNTPQSSCSGLHDTNTEDFQYSFLDSVEDDMNVYVSY